MLEPTARDLCVGEDSPPARAGGSSGRLAWAEQVGDTVHLSWSTDAVHLFDGETEKRLGR